ncbi:MAG: hypothetical protein M3442_08630 [Chloroflexota bacterium]|nr:hypothetical protein [Chloroflexota bacterium]
MQRSVVTLALLVAWSNLQLQTGVATAAALDARAVAAQFLLAYLAAFWIQLGWPCTAGKRSSKVIQAEENSARHQARSTA